MAGVNKGKRQTSGGDARTNPSKTHGTGSSAPPKPVKPSKVAQLFPKNWMLKTLPAPDATESDKVTKKKRRRVKSFGEKVAEVRPTVMDDLREVEEKGQVAHLVKGMWLGIEEEKSELKMAKSELEKDLARAKTEAMKEVRQLKATNAEVVDTIKADTYVEVEDEEAEVVGVVDGLDGISCQIVLDNHGDDVELPEGGSEKVELVESHARKDNVLMCNREFAEQFDRMKEANENREDQYVKVYFRLEKLNHVISDLTLQVNEKYSEIKKVYLRPQSVPRNSNVRSTCWLRKERAGVNETKIHRKGRQAEGSLRNSIGFGGRN
ncbi:hypothetical protein GIB67_014797 [Kingdonia uniflora]|uniref:Uncharacterized protein n=1 Tax=Kingdonia uniflora TaxID=39325 RepID=A0A7J7NVA3_9MAGN|nr:hypothetical protein GIB67_014797 [Kingdonia uniflora]